MTADGGLDAVDYNRGQRITTSTLDTDVYDFAEQRRRLVAELRAEGVRDERVLAALGRVPREAFIPDHERQYAYRNAALPIDEGQTISQPFVVAVMTEALALSGTEHVLEIGTGSGYQTAILAELARSVVSVERQPRLLDRARAVLVALGYRSIEFQLTNGSLGWPARAPYDAIVVTAAGPRVPKQLLEQLTPRGRLVMPVGTADQQQLVLVVGENGRTIERRLGPVRFVPLIGEAGWEEP